MQNREEIFQSLKSSVKSQTDFHDLADTLQKEGIGHEKKLFYAPLVGSGAGLLLSANAVVGADFSVEILSAVLPSIWLFFLSVVASIISALLYIKELQYSYNYNLCKGNAENSYMNLRGRLKLFEPTHANTTIDSISEEDLLLFDRIVEFETSATEHFNASKKKSVLSKMMFRLASGFFVLAIVIPLIVLSLKTEFIFL